MVFTVEPILTLYRGGQAICWEDEWTYQIPGNPSAQWEHMVRVASDGPEILTLLQD